MAKISCIAASIILLICGVMHLQGTFFSTDLYPEDMDLIARLKSSHIQMAKSGILWKLWIGFNAMFSAGLIFIGSIMLYFALKHFDLFLRRQRFIFLLTIACNAFFVWVGWKYMIRPFLISMSVPLVLFVTGYILILIKRPNSQNEKKHYSPQ
jgi:hypothetical protein